MTQESAEPKSVSWRQRGKISDEEWAGIRATVDAAIAAREAARKPQRGYPLCFGYRRCSHKDSAASGLGMDAQKDIVERYFEFLKAEHPELRWGDWIEDPAVSAYAGNRHRFFQRPDGQRLLDLAQPGDHIIVAKLDRAFRDVRDCLASMDLFKERGIIFHACDFRIDTDTANGELMLTFMAAIARWQSRYISERTKAGLNARTKKGLPLGPVPAGSKAVGTMSEKERKRRKGKGSPRHFVPDEAACSIMAEIVRVRQAGLSWKQISDHVESQLAACENRPPEERYWRRQWSPRYCRRAYVAELALRAQAAVARKVSPSPAPVSPTPEVAGQPTP